MEKIRSGIDPLASIKSLRRSLTKLVTFLSSRISVAAILITGLLMGFRHWWQATLAFPVT